MESKNIFDLEQAISEWRKQMIAGGVRRPNILDELESHLREHVAQLMRSGLNKQQAFETAVRSLGKSATLKAEFAKTNSASRSRHRKDMVSALGVGLALFAVGIGFCYFVMIPLGMLASGQYAAWLGSGTTYVDAQAYINFVCKFELATGIAFALPAGLLFLVRVGILDRQKIAGFRRRAIVINLVLGALLTTPEVLTQILLFVVLQAVYEATVWLAPRWEHPEQKYV
jgi:hypothetical protein